MITLYCGIFYISDISKDVEKLKEIEIAVPITGANCNNLVLKYIVTLAEWIKMFLFVVIVLANLFFLLFWLYRMVYVVKYHMLSKMEKMYLKFIVFGDE